MAEAGFSFKQFSRFADERFGRQIEALCDQAQSYLELIGDMIRRGIDLERPRIISMLVSLSNTVDFLRLRRSDFLRFELHKPAALAEECASFYEEQMREARRLTSISLDEVEIARRHY